ncbi:MULTISPECIES: hypothetical protein [unclassified Bradyrhizobium]|uniref:hypothetical protein n=1 Tax=unclassified Bradyrhizobium TaxID=2631580 RepID=UPI0004111A1B|nr:MULTISPECIES: hypothetical protein [unclassified Bradyrhizobium]
MSRISIVKRAAHTAAAAFVFASLLSPANASQSDTIRVFPDLQISATADHTNVNAAALTSRRPWLAPVGHRQPQRADAPKPETVSAWERQQQQFDQDVDRKLVICRGC